MSNHTALLAFADAAWDPPVVATASLAAWLTAAEVPASTYRVAPAALDSLAVGLELHQRRPSLVGLWCSPDRLAGIDATVARLRALLPESRFVLLGPAFATPTDAGRLLTRIDGDCAIVGEAEGPLLELARALQAAPMASSSALPGVSVRTAAGIAHRPAPGGALDPARLPSPLASGHLPLQPGHGAVWLEVLRGPLPFSPLPIDLQSGPPRPIPLDRLRDDLTRVLEAEVPILHLVSTPLDAVPGHLRSVLELLAERNRRTAVCLELSRAPDPALAAALNAAGVARLELRHPAGGPGDAGGGMALERAALRQLTGLGIRTTVRLPIGRPGDTAEALRRRLDYYLTVSGLQLRLEPVRAWPGHPLRVALQEAIASYGTSAEMVPDAHAASAPSSTGLEASPLLADAPAYEVLSTPDLPADQAFTLRREGLSLERVLAQHPATLRLLARIVSAHPSSLLQSFTAWEAIQRPPAGSGSSSLRRHLARFAREALLEAGRLDRLPFIDALLEYEQWLHAPSRPVATVHPVGYEPGQFDAVVLARAPGFELRTWPFDMPALVGGGGVEDAPLRRTHLLLRRRGLRTPVVMHLSEYERDLIERVDGARTVGELLEGSRGIAEGSAAAALDPESRLLWLLERGALYVKRVGAVEEPPTPPGKGKILSFRARSPGGPGG